MIKVGKALAISEQGKRTNNEDNYGFAEYSHFVLCDGVGGAAKGEIASDIVVKQFVHAFQQNQSTNPEGVLQMAEAELSEYGQKNPDSAGMATTLTFSQVRKNGILVAWCGDSRIYQFRKGKAIFQTEDHSWVNEAVHSGIITKEEAVNHPKSNIITRAIMGNEKPAELDSRLITDVEKGDYFLHCSDGVLETWTNPDLEALFAQGFDLEEVMVQLTNECQKLSKDNFTALLYQVELADVTGILDPAEITLGGKRKIPTSVKRTFAPKSFLLLFGILLACLAIGFWVFNGQTDQPTTKKPKQKLVATPNSKKDSPKNTILQKGDSNAFKIDPTISNDTTKGADTKLKIVLKERKKQSPTHANPKLPHP